MHVAIFGGAGTVGATTAYALSVADPTLDVTLVDVESDAARGHARDIKHANAHGSHAVGKRFLDGRAATATGTMDGAAPAEIADRDPDLIVVAASAPRPSGAQTREGGRRLYLEDNLAIATDVADAIAPLDPVPVVAVTNPLDPVTYRLHERTGWPRRRFVGYSLSETARIAAIIAKRRGCQPGAVYCPVMGEHGEQMVPLFSRARVEGAPVSFTAEERASLTDGMKDAPYEIIALRGGAETSRWVTSHGVAALAKCMLDGGVDEPVCLSTPLDGEYGFEGVSLGVPMTLSADGVDEIVDWELSDDERAGLETAYAAIRDDLRVDA